MLSHDNTIVKFEKEREAGRRRPARDVETKSMEALAAPYFGLSIVFCDKAEAENAEKWSRKAYECIEKLDDPFTQSWGNLAVGYFCLEKGRLDETEKKLIVALDYARNIALSIS